MNTGVKLKKNLAVSNTAPQKNDPHWNKHRQNKTSVQAYLNDEEIELVDRIKAQKKFASYRELLVGLCQEAEGQAHQLKPSRIKAIQNFKPIKNKPEAKKQSRHDVDILQLKITSHCVRPVIWREVLVPCSITLDAFHQCIMELFGLEGFHLYEFEGVGRDYEDTNIKLAQIFKSQKTLHYRYDFGDNWEFSITKQKSVAYDPQKSYPSCVKSKGGMMLEDCGATYGYQLITKWCRKKTSSTRRALLDYLCDPELLQEYKTFKPDFFDMKAFNEHCTKYDLDGMKTKEGTMFLTS